MVNQRQGHERHTSSNGRSNVDQIEDYANAGSDRKMSYKGEQQNIMQMVIMLCPISIFFTMFSTIIPGQSTIH